MTNTSVWNDPRVRAALTDRGPDDIALLSCPQCGAYGYYNEGSHFFCRFCEQTWHCCTENEEPPLTDSPFF